MNLYTETEECLKENGMSFDDVKYIIGRDRNGDEYEIDIKDFIHVASKFDYDEGYGKVEVPIGFLICGDGWWLERYEYDGSENWVMKVQPERPTEKKKLISISNEDRFYPYCVFN